MYLQKETGLYTRGQIDEERRIAIVTMDHVVGLTRNIYTTDRNGIQRDVGAKSVAPSLQPTPAEKLRQMG